MAQDTTWWITTNRLVFDDEVNPRPISQRRVEKIAANLDPDKMGVIAVAPAQGAPKHYAVIDGRHRVSAVRLWAGNDEQKVECKVHRRISRERQADLFDGLNDFVTPSPMSRFVARRTAGKPEAVDIDNIVRKAGLRIGTGSSPGVVASVSTLTRIYRGWASEYDPEKAHPDLLRDTLNVVVTAWGKDPAALQGPVLAGVALVLLRYGDAVEMATLKTRLSSLSGGPSRLIGMARTYKEANGSSIDRNVAAAVVNLYNRGKRGKSLPDWWG